MAAEFLCPEGMAERASDRESLHLSGVWFSAALGGASGGKGKQLEDIFPPSLPYSFVITLFPSPPPKRHIQFGVTLSSLYWPDFSAAGSQAQVPSLVSFFPLKSLLHALPDSGVHEGLKHEEKTGLVNTLEVSKV